MVNNFNPQEILKIAINVEANGEELYALLEGKAKDKKIKDMWKYLKDEEAGHHKTFQDILDNIGDYVVYEFSSGEYEAYLKAISSQYIFTQELIDKKTKELFASDIDAINFAINIEKDSILTYDALKGYILIEKQPVLNKIIEEEKRHLEKLTVLKEYVKEA